MRAFKRPTQESAEPSDRKTWRRNTADEGHRALESSVGMARGKMGRGDVVSIRDGLYRAPQVPHACHSIPALQCRISWSEARQPQNRNMGNDAATSGLVAALRQVLAACTNNVEPPSLETEYGEQPDPLQTLTLIQALLTASVDEHQTRQLVDLMGQVLAAMRDRHETAARSLADLTARQRQVMDLVLAGHPSKNIAADLAISQRTVENHRAAIMRKAGVKSLPELARLGMHCL